MWPLTDITVYEDSFTMLKSDKKFRFKVNYLMDFYHNSLNGYKPLKTSRICIHLVKEVTQLKPRFSGSICHEQLLFDEKKYNTLSDSQQNKYLVKIIHDVLLSLCESCNWDKDPFEKAYKNVVDRNYIFEKIYPAKKSRDRKHEGAVMISKTEEFVTLSVIITSEEDQIIVPIIRKENFPFFDEIYQLAQKTRWFNNDSFGVSTPKNDLKVFYILSENRVEEIYKFIE